MSLSAKRDAKLRKKLAAYWRRKRSRIPGLAKELHALEQNSPTPGYIFLRVVLKRVFDDPPKSMAKLYKNRDDCNREFALMVDSYKEAILDELEKLEKLSA